MSDQLLAIAPEALPRLPHGVRLIESQAHGGWVLLAPERVFKADGIAAVILKRCDGSVSIAEMADEFAAAYKAPRERILTDIVKLLQTLADKRMLDVAP